MAGPMNGIEDGSVILPGGFGAAGQPRAPIGGIAVHAKWTGRTLRLDVQDSGGGFDRTAVPAPGAMIASGRTGSGRGLTILEGLRDRVRLARGGTMIALSFRLGNARE